MDSHISKVDVRVRDVISIICVARIAKSRKAMCVSVINQLDSIHAWSGVVIDERGAKGELR